MRKVWEALTLAFGSGLEAEMRAQRRAAQQLDRALRDALGETGR